MKFQDPVMMNQSVVFQNGYRIYVTRNRWVEEPQQFPRLRALLDFYLAKNGWPFQVKESTDISEARLLRYWKEAVPR